MPKATLRSILSAVARALRPQPSRTAELDRPRLELLLATIAQNVRASSGADLPPSFAMLEVLLRAVPAGHLTATIDRMDAVDRDDIRELLERMRPQSLPPVEVEPTVDAIEEEVVVERELPSGSDIGDPRIIERLRQARLDAFLLSGDSRLERGVLDRVAAGEFDSVTSERMLTTIIDGSGDDANRKRALSFVRPDPFAKERTLRALAEIAAWGIDRGVELTGKVFRFRLYGTAEGEIGMTILGGRVIHFNPLPLLRGETDGRRIVEAIILHEIGHHRYNTGPQWVPIREQAEEEHLHSLLNLVLDEHLERNLRTMNTEWGDSLKILGAWAFQRTSRTIDVAQLLALLQASSFRVLHAAELEPARERTRVSINSGRLLRELEAHGSSFSRFLRALRMGLGNRTRDAKVGEALALFGKGFRDASPEQLLQTARELRRIFGGETGIGDALSLHDAAKADASELAERLPGITDDDLSAEIDSIRQRPSERAPRKAKTDKSPITINRGSDTDFDPIDEIVAVAYDAEAHRALAARVAGWSRRLRRFFERLGISRITLRQRTSGSAVDRLALQRAVIRHDPRILTARRTVFHSDLFIGVVIDCSGSMAGADSMERAQLFGALIAEATRKLDGVDARFFGFTDDVIYDAGTSERCAVAQLAPHGGNNDAAALAHVARVANASRRSAKLLVMISDGSPTECSVDALSALVKRLVASGLACAQVAVQPIEEVCFPDYVLVDDEDLSYAVSRFGRIIVRLVRKVTAR